MVQDSGRGRQGREWVSERGNFFGSTFVELRTSDPAASSLSLAAGLALIEAVEAAVPGRQLMLKWPNDLMLGTAKLAGILLERSDERVVVGFGVNLATAPELAGRETASLSGALLPQAFAPILAGCFARMVALWRSSNQEAFARAWLARAHPIGTPLKIHGAAGQVVSGAFEGIDADGALRLRCDDEVKRFHAGDAEL